jgi:ribosomal protein L40E
LLHRQPRRKWKKNLSFTSRQTGEQVFVEEALLRPLRCWECKTINPADASVCVKCGTFLKLETAIAAEEKRRNEIEEMRRNIGTLKSMVLGSGPGVIHSIEQLESLVASQKQITEDLRVDSWLSFMERDRAS